MISDWAISWAFRSTKKLQSVCFEIFFYILYIYLWFHIYQFLSFQPCVIFYDMKNDMKCLTILPTRKQTWNWLPKSLLKSISWNFNGTNAMLIWLHLRIPFRIRMLMTCFWHSFSHQGWFISNKERKRERSRAKERVAEREEEREREKERDLMARIFMPVSICFLLTSEACDRLQNSSKEFLW